MVKIPSCKEDFSGEAFENWIYNFARSKNPELYVAYPR